MHVVIETWTPKEKWLATDEETRRRFFDEVREGMAEMSKAGIETLGWGRVDQDADRPSAHEWFAVWRTPNSATSAAFLEGVDRSGWYEYFEQVNVVGELLPAENAMDVHVALVKS